MLQGFLQRHRRRFPGYIIGFCRSFTQVTTSEGIISGNLLNLGSKWLGKPTYLLGHSLGFQTILQPLGMKVSRPRGLVTFVTSSFSQVSLFKGHVFTLPQCPRPGAVLKTRFGRNDLEGYLSQQKFQKDQDGLSGLFGFSYSVIPIGRIFPLCLLFD